MSRLKSAHIVANGSIPEEQIVSFEEIRKKLETARVKGLRPIGQSYQVAV